MNQPTHRGRSTELNRRVYGYYVFVAEYALEYKYQIHEYNKERKYTIEKYVDPTTIGRNTGLKDKNGVEIYEGDIVQKGTGDYLHVYRDEPFARYLVGKQSGSSTELDMYIAKSLSVQNNIHQNPELLSAQIFEKIQPPALTKQGDKARVNISIENIKEKSD